MTLIKINLEKITTNSYKNRPFSLFLMEYIDETKINEKIMLKDLMIAYNDYCTRQKVPADSRVNEKTVSNSIALILSAMNCEVISSRTNKGRYYIFSNVKEEEKTDSSTPSSMSRVLSRRERDKELEKFQIKQIIKETVSKKRTWASSFYKTETQSFIKQMLISKNYQSEIFILNKMTLKKIVSQLNLKTIQVPIITTSQIQRSLEFNFNELNNVKLPPVNVLELKNNNATKKVAITNICLAFLKPFNYTSLQIKTLIEIWENELEVSEKEEQNLRSGLANPKTKSTKLIVLDKIKQIKNKKWEKLMTQKVKITKNPIKKNQYIIDYRNQSELHKFEILDKTLLTKLKNINNQNINPFTVEGLNIISQIILLLWVYFDEIKIIKDYNFLDEKLIPKSTELIDLKYSRHLKMETDHQILKRTDGITWEDFFSYISLKRKKRISHQLLTIDEIDISLKTVGFIYVNDFYRMFCSAIIDWDAFFSGSTKVNRLQILPDESIKNFLQGQGPLKKRSFHFFQTFCKHVQHFFELYQFETMMELSKNFESFGSYLTDPEINNLYNICLYKPRQLILLSYYNLNFYTSFQLQVLFTDQKIIQLNKQQEAIFQSFAEFSKISAIKEIYKDILALIEMKIYPSTLERLNELFIPDKILTGTQLLSYLKQAFNKVPLIKLPIGNLLWSKITTTKYYDHFSVSYKIFCPTLLPPGIAYYSFLETLKEQYYLNLFILEDLLEFNVKELEAQVIFTVVPMTNLETIDPSLATLTHLTKEGLFYTKTDLTNVQKLKTLFQLVDNRNTSRFLTSSTGQVKRNVSFQNLLYNLENNSVTKTVLLRASYPNKVLIDTIKFNFYYDKNKKTSVLASFFSKKNQFNDISNELIKGQKKSDPKIDLFWLEMVANLSYYYLLNFSESNINLAILNHNLLPKPGEKNKAPFKWISLINEEESVLKKLSELINDQFND